MTARSGRVETSGEDAPPIQLFATARSHFSRKVRLLLDHYGAPYEVLDIGDVSRADPALFDGNPVMGVPVLRDGAVWLIESDHIAAYLADRLDPQDRFGVHERDPARLNARAVLNAVMGGEVKLVLAERTGLETAPHEFFQKARATIERGLAWLEARADMLAPDAPRYLDFHFISAWDHLAYYDLVALNHPRLRAVSEALSAQETIAQSAPHMLAAN